MRRDGAVEPATGRESARGALLVGSAALLAGFVFVCTSDDGARVRFAFGGSDASGLDSSSIVIIFTDADEEQTFDGRDFRLAAGSPSPRSPSFDTSGSGWLSVDVRVRDHAGEARSTGRVTLPLGEGRRYDVTVAAGRGNPGCAACREVRAFPLERVSGSAGDSLYVGWASSETSGAVVD